MRIRAGRQMECRQEHRQNSKEQGRWGDNLRNGRERGRRRREQRRGHAATQTADGGEEASINRGGEWKRKRGTKKRKNKTVDDVSRGGVRATNHGAFPQGVQIDKVPPLHQARGACPVEDDLIAPLELCAFDLGKAPTPPGSCPFFRCRGLRPADLEPQCPEMRFFIC
ncbi:uncharacterized protein VTP21DRAFT_6820 [Calcarisporiella thermophila]|uniref:uncharacterized protein n=1 Tax=Calcarisporiella thermophila TaxID=911321 RepID=UPI0037439E42